MLAIGQSELPGSSHELDQLDTWATGPGEDQLFDLSTTGKPAVFESKKKLSY